MGSDVHYSKGRSAHHVMVEVLRIDRYTVTDADFATLVAAVAGAGARSKCLPMLCNSTGCWSSILATVLAIAVAPDLKLLIEPTRAAGIGRT